MEKLYVFDDNGKKVGRFSLKIDKEEGETTATKILYVHISIRAYFEGKLSESIVTGTVNSKLKTLEEIRYECVTLTIQVIIQMSELLLILKQIIHYS